MESGAGSQTNLVSSNDPLPVLYSFRRCPYAIRARMAVFGAGIKVNLCEVSLKDKPQAMLKASSKGTVPVLCLGDQVIDESLDIMLWALSIADPDGWYAALSESKKKQAFQLIEENDTDFKQWLDKYKYADRFPEHSPEFYRKQCEPFLLKLEQILQHQPWLLGSKITLADIALFPFMRQFSMVDQVWFEQCQHQHLKAWLKTLLDLPLFSRIMVKSK